MNALDLITDALLCELRLEWHIVEIPRHSNQGGRLFHVYPYTDLCFNPDRVHVWSTKDNYHTEVYYIDKNITAKLANAVQTSQTINACTHHINDTHRFRAVNVGQYYGSALGSLAVYSTDGRGFSLASGKVTGDSFRCTIHFFKDRLTIHPRRLPDYLGKGQTMGDELGAVLYADPEMFDKLTALIEVTEVGQ